MRPGASNASIPFPAVYSLDGLDVAVGSTAVPRRETGIAVMRQAAKVSHKRYRGAAGRALGCRWRLRDFARHPALRGRRAERDKHAPGR